MPNAIDVLAVFPHRSSKDDMLKERIAVALLLMPLVLWVIADGSWLYLFVVTTALCLAAAEYGLLFRKLGLRPALPLLVLGVLALVVSRFQAGFEHADLILAAVCLLALGWHAVDFERGASQSGLDFAVTLSGVLYLGWVGSYLISLRQLENGTWWVMLALPIVWLADSGAYFVGRAWGRHRLAIRLSPKKTWEGYFAGVITGVLTGMLFAPLWSIGASPNAAFGPGIGALMGLIISGLSPLGDLGISMIKRQMRVKDSGNLIPGHGGALDRLDTWLWAAVLGFYVVDWFVL